MIRRTGSALAITLGIAWATTACFVPAPQPSDAWQRDPQAAALAVVALARDVDEQAERIEAIFDRQDDPARHAALLDSLAAMGELENARVVRVESLESIGRVAVDMAGDLTGGGAADWSIQFAERPEGTLQAIWFAGPGVEWPPRQSRDTGLTTSPQP